MRENNIIIRKYLPSDRDTVRAISVQTSFLEDPHLYLDDQSLIADALTLYFTDYESESSFVAVFAGRVVGYLIGTTSSDRMDKILHEKILPFLIFKIIQERLFMNKSFLTLGWNSFLSALKGEFRFPDLNKEYPGLFHINLDKDFRKYGLGRKLIERFEQYLLENNIRALHIGTMSERAKNFFIRNSFEVLFSSKRSYMTYRLREKTVFYLLGKKL